MAAVANVSAFHDWLIGQDLSPKTATVYSAMIDYGKRRGDVAQAVRIAHTQGTLKVVRAAVGWWSRWTRDRRVLRRTLELSRKQVRVMKTNTVTEKERTVLCARLHYLEEPYRSAMVIVACSGLRLRQAFGITREQAEIGSNERVPLGDDFWLPPEDVQQAFRVLVRYGAWEHIMDLFGRSYIHAYQQVAHILHHECRRAGLRRIRPAELGRTS